MSTWTVEKAYKVRAQFASLVSKDAKPHVVRMGIEIVAFTIKGVYDALIIIYNIQSIFITLSLISFSNIKIMRVMVLKSYTIFLDFTMQFVTNVAKAQDNV